MHNINALLPVLPVSAGGSVATQADTATIDWDALPVPLKYQICDCLNAGDRARLADVSRTWREIVVSKRFETMARSVIARREGVSPGDCPKPPDRNGTGLAGELQAKGYTHAAMLVGLYAACERLSLMSPERAVFDTLPDIGLGSGLILLSPSNDAEFIGIPHVGIDVVLVSADGIRPFPQALSDVTFFEEPRLGIINAMLSRGSAGKTWIVRGSDDAPYLFDRSSDALLPFPAAFTIPEVQHLVPAVSRDGRYVAASYTLPDDGDIRLRVHDRMNNTTITETALHGTVSQQLSVDGDGTVVIGGRDRYEVKAGEDGQTVERTPLPAGHLAVRLSPDERYIVSRHDTTGEVRFCDRVDGGFIVLAADDKPARDKKQALSVAAGPAMAMAAVAYDDGTLAVFDLLTVEERLPAAEVHTEILFPRLRLQLQDAQLRNNFYSHVVTWFDLDGGGLHAAYPSRVSVHGLPGTGLMHLLFD